MNFNLSSINAVEQQILGRRHSTPALCTIARHRSGLSLRDTANEIGISHVTLLQWEKVSDPRLVEWWTQQGYIFPPAPKNTIVVKIGRDKQVNIGRPIIDRGVSWNSGMILKRSYESHLPGAHQYTVDEKQGVYKFFSGVHGKRSAVIRFD